MGALLLAACGDVPGPTLLLAPQQTLRFSIPADVPSLDPGLAQPGTAADLVQNVFDGLLRLSDDDSSVVPDLATAMPTVSADGRTYTFRLDPKARFSNGDAVTAADVVFSWRRADAMKGPGPALLAGVDMQALAAPGATPDPLTLVVRLAVANGSFPRQVAQAAAAVVDPAVVARPGDPDGMHSDPATGWATRPETLVGTGPFRLVARKPGASLTFKPVAGWWGSPKPSLREVDVDVQPSATAAFDLYTSGTYDADGFAGMPLPDAGVAARLKSGQDDLHTPSGPGATWLAFNFGPGSPVSGLGGSGRDLRRALGYGIDRVALAQSVCDGGGPGCAPAQGGLIPAGMAGYLGLGADPLATFDPGAGKSLLQGLPAHTPQLTFGYEDSPQARAVVANLVAQWHANLGLDIATPVAVPASQWLARRAAYSLSLHSYEPQYDGPEEWYGPLFQSSSAAAIGFADPAFDGLVGTAEAQPLLSSASAYEAAAARLSDAVAYAPLLYGSRQVVFKTYLRGAIVFSARDGRWNLIEVLQH